MRRFKSTFSPYLSDAAAFALLVMTLVIVTIGITTTQQVKQAGDYRVVTSGVIAG